MDAFRKGETREEIIELLRKVVVELIRSLRYFDFGFTEMENHLRMRSNFQHELSAARHLWNNAIRLITTFSNDPTTWSLNKTLSIKIINARLGMTRNLKHVESTLCLNINAIRPAISQQHLIFITLSKLSCLNKPLASLVKENTTKCFEILFREITKSPIATSKYPNEVDRVQKI